VAEELSGFKYDGKSYVERDLKKDKEYARDVAMRVIADHIRTITFTIADGQLPSNNGAGYVIRRILRRAVRYGNKYLGMEEPFIHHLVPVLANQFEGIFPEVKAQQDFISKLIKEEEIAFLRTLSLGVKRFENHIKELNTKEISGQFAFELYDTFGFPYDLTDLMARENGFTINEAVFKSELQAQKTRSKADAQKEAGDWIIVQASNELPRFVGYDVLEVHSSILRYREVSQKGKKQYQVVFDVKSVLKKETVDARL
jgi:alanyl-tRNA synthetase